MNLNAIANAVIVAITPNYTGSLLRSTGSAKTADYGRAPTYAAAVSAPMQVQALSGREIQHLDSLNIQGILRAVYINGTVQGLNRTAMKGGDILQIPTGISGASYDTWLVAQVLEPWDAGGWTKVAVVLQDPGST